jgi:chromosome segregation ATPase
MRRLRHAKWAFFLLVLAVLGCNQRQQPAGDLDQEKAALQQQLAATQAELETLREEYEMFQGGLAESASEVDELLARNHEQEVELKDLRKKFEAAMRLLGVCRTEVERLRKGSAPSAGAR